MKRTLLGLSLLAIACGADDAAPVDDTIETRCTPAATAAVSVDPADEPCELLSSYRFFSDMVTQTPSDRVVPYDVNSPLFSDYADKQRYLWVPEGEAIDYTDAGPLDFPVGSVLIKSFGFEGERWIETRLLVLEESGWDGRVYRWDEDQREARINVAGGVIDVSWLHQGEPRDLEYIVPNINQCEACHANDDVPQLLGPQTRHLNRDYSYESGVANQLTHLAGLGLLVGAPDDPDTAPRTPVWDDPQTGTLEERARAWLDINCAHCHNPAGPARTSGLDLSFAQSDPRSYGVCKTPVAAGAGSGGLQYNIVPGNPDESILVFRLEATKPDIRMPELLRQTVHEESAVLIREWISSLSGTCD